MSICSSDWEVLDESTNSEWSYLDDNSTVIHRQPLILNDSFEKKLYKSQLEIKIKETSRTVTKVAKQLSNEANKSQLEINRKETPRAVTKVPIQLSNEANKFLCSLYIRSRELKNTAITPKYINRSHRSGKNGHKAKTKNHFKHPNFHVPNQHGRPRQSVKS